MEIKVWNMKDHFIKILAVMGLLLCAGCTRQRQTAGKNNPADRGTVKEESAMEIMIQDEHDTTVRFVLFSSPAAKSFYEQLPLRVNVEDYSDNEKIFHPLKELETQDTPQAVASSGTLAYYKPWNNIVLFYENGQPSDTLYALGEAVSGKDNIKRLQGMINITKYKNNTVSKKQKVKEEQQRVKAHIGTKTFTLSLHDSESARAFLKRFPMTVTMQEPNGNELFAYMDENLPTDAQRATKIHTGDVKLFGRDCPMLFYKDFATAYSYTSLGKVDDAEALAQAWKVGNKEVIFTY
ncbi:MAG: hypothetical protein KHY42_14810 [Erysipelotrichaceae bacterium]|nr:hypothetical protein [Erysipelotrichaceae bacterium]